MKGETYDARHNHGILFLEEFPSDEDSQKDNEADKESNYSAAIPGMCLPTILQREDIASEQANHESCAYKVELQDLFFPGGFHRLRGFVRLEEEEGNNGCDTADGQVDPEALKCC
jgi:hypothetical protein